MIEFAEFRTLNNYVSQTMWFSFFNCIKNWNWTKVQNIYQNNFVTTFYTNFFQNEKMQIMKSNVWLQLTWKDYQLQWDSNSYGGINVLMLPPDKVWKPDIALFNTYLLFEYKPYQRFSTLYWKLTTLLLICCRHWWSVLTSYYWLMAIDQALKMRWLNIKYYFD